MEKTDLPDQRSIFKQLANYRKLKEYRKELAVIENYLRAIEARNKAKQKEWMAMHPQAAKAGRAMLRTLGADQLSAFGMEDTVSRMLKRREVVVQKLSGKKISRVKKNSEEAARQKKASETAKKVKARKAAEVAEKKAAIEAKKNAASEKKAAVTAKKIAEAQAKKEAAAAKKAAAAQAKKALAKAAKKEAIEAARKAAALAKARPSLFVISLQYIVPTEKIDDMMARHVVFLNRHFQAGTFLTAGRKVPRTGGIIIARGKSRAAIERIVAQDPFVKNKYAAADITEFWASRSTKEFQRLL